MPTEPFSPEDNKRQAELVRDAIIADAPANPVLAAQQKVMAWTFYGLIYGSRAVASALLGGVMAVASSVAAGVLQLFGASRRENQSAYNTVIAEALSELFGVDVSTEDIPAGGDHRAQLARAQALGGKLHDLLTEQFGGRTGEQQGRGEKAARAFTGYGLNYATGTALLSVITEMESLGFFKEFGKIGEDVSAGLGLARLQRQALSPLIRNLIAEPFDQELRHRYRPDRLTDKQYVNAFHRGGIDENRLRDELATKGYKDEDINQLIVELTAHLTDTDLARLVRWGVISYQDAVTALVASGVPHPTAEKNLRATLLSRADSTISTYLNKLQTVYIEGQIDEGEFQKLFERLPLGDDEREWELNLVGLQKDLPRRKLTLAQMESAYIAAIIGLDEFEVWMEGEGYTENDQLVLEYLLLLKAEKAADKEKLASERKERKAAREAAKISK